MEEKERKIRRKEKKKKEKEEDAGGRGICNSEYFREFLETSATGSKFRNTRIENKRGFERGRENVRFQLLAFNEISATIIRTLIQFPSSVTIFESMLRKHNEWNSIYPYFESNFEN